MTTSIILPAIQIILSGLLTAAILFQQSDAGLGSAFGGDGGDGGDGGHVRRGGEKMLFRATIALSVLFCISIIASLFTL